MDARLCSAGTDVRKNHDGAAKVAAFLASEDARKKITDKKHVA
jgi:hypothetical protein